MISIILASSFYIKPNQVLIRLQKPAGYLSLSLKLVYLLTFTSSQISFNQLVLVLIIFNVCLGLTFQITPHVKNITDFTFNDLLVETVFRGLDLQLALAQPQPTYKVRHLKSGLKFTLAVLEAGGSPAERLLSGGLQDVLLSLFNEPNMAVSLKVR